MEEDLIIQCLNDEHICVSLQNVSPIKHQGSANVKDGHLYLQGNHAHTNCRTFAVYAPGQWLSAAVEKKEMKDV